MPTSPHSAISTRFANSAARTGSWRTKGGHAALSAAINVLIDSWESEGKISVTMRQTHLGGDKLFVDYAGDTAPVVIDRLTGEIRKAQIFVAVLGASNFTYAEATWTQSLADWIGAHTRAFEAIGGVPRLVVPDNTRTAVIKACLYEP